MKSNNKFGVVAALTLAASILAGPAYAGGGPLYVYDAQTGKPYAWPNGATVPVYTDTGAPGFSNASLESITARVAFAYKQWTDVETSDFRAEVVGTLADLGYADITGISPDAEGTLPPNALEIIGQFNGGGIHVMFDADGSIISNVLGAPSDVLGVASPEAADGGVITEGWAVINGGVIDWNAVDWDNVDWENPNFPILNEAQMAGVFTHEFGHTLNLAHSQTNGQAYFFGATYGIKPQPMGCPAPFAGDVQADDVETMYPYISPWRTSTAQSTLGRDDEVALSNLYPAAGWPQNYGSIAGKVTLKDGVSQLMGVNVVARNINNPFQDAISAMSGDQTQGWIGPDGRFRINGLKPGEQYVLYIEEIVAGGYPTSPATIPGPQEFWNGANESGNSQTDDPCASATITPSAGVVTRADIAVNGTPKSPQFIRIPELIASDASNNGKTVSGTYFGFGSWLYDVDSGNFTVIDGAMGAPHLSGNGQVVATTIGNGGAGLWEDAAIWSKTTGLRGIGRLDPKGGNDSCDYFRSTAFDIDSAGGTIVGLGWQGCDAVGFKWTAKTGMKPLLPPPGYHDSSRANAISGDGTLIAGWTQDQYGQWIGTVWKNDKAMLIGTDTQAGYLGEANAVNYDGSMVVGGMIDWWNGIWDAYAWNSKTNKTTRLGSLPCPAGAWFCDFMPTLPTTAFGVSDSGKVVVGRAGDWSTGEQSFIWTPGMGMKDLNLFLQRQGMMEAFKVNLLYPIGVSRSGTYITGMGVTPLEAQSFMVKLDQVWVCHHGKSVLSGFPEGMESHLAHGDADGLCAADRPKMPGV